MSEPNARLITLYQKQAKTYDRSGVQGLDAWRKRAVKQLHLKRGDLVVDVGCGTGLNFPWLQEAVGPQGKIIGVDLTDAMLEQAKHRITKEGWTNVELVQADATSYVFPTQVNGVLSTFALTFFPEAQRVIQNGCQALVPGARWVVVDMAWPCALPWWFSHLLFFLRLSRYGITAEVVRRRPWQKVWSAMQQSLAEAGWQPFWGGFFYLAWGKQPEPPA